MYHKYFSSVDHISIFLKMLLDNKKTLMLLKVVISLFHGWCFYTVSNKFLVTSVSRSFPPVFPRKVRVLAFTFRSMFHFNVILD